MRILYRDENLELRKKICKYFSHEKRLYTKIENSVNIFQNN